VLGAPFARNLLRPIQLHGLIGSGLVHAGTDSRTLSATNPTVGLCTLPSAVVGQNLLAVYRANQAFWA